MQRKLPSERIAAAAAAVIFHLLLIALLIRADKLPGTDQSDEEHKGILYLLRLSQPVGQSPERAHAARRRPRRVWPPSGPHMPIFAAPPELPRAIPVPSGPRVNWNQEAAVVAQTVTGARGSGARPASGEHEHSPYHTCGPTPGFAWDPEPKKVGFVGFMPYLRTKRCFITLIGFGCSIGRLPEPNGQLLAAVRDGPATFSSVPDDDNCDK